MSHKHNYRKVGQKTRIEGRYQYTDVSEECQTRDTTCDRRVRVTTIKKRFNHHHHFVITETRLLPNGKYKVTVKCTNTTGCPLEGDTISGDRDRPRWLYGNPNRHGNCRS